MFTVPLDMLESVRTTCIQFILIARNSHDRNNTQRAVRVFRRQHESRKLSLLQCVCVCVCSLAMSSSLVLPQEKGTEIESLFTKWLQLVELSSKSTSESDTSSSKTTEENEDDAMRAISGNEDATDIALKILRTHPFIRAKDVVDIERKEHIFRVQGFSCDVWKFRKWTRSKSGHKFKKIGGGVSDDSLYTLSPVLRVLLPRGLHFLEVRRKGKDDVVDRFWFRGISKFTGLLAGDEDEVSNSHNASSDFFYGGKKLSDAKTFVQTLKSNGENAKMSCRTIDGVLYLLAGSKNTCLIWPALDPSTKYYPAVEAISSSSKHADLFDALRCCDKPEFQPAPHIAKIFSTWFLSRTEAQRVAFLSEFRQLHVATIMGEINRPWGEHLLPISDVYLECFAVLVGEQCARPIAPQRAFRFFHNHGISDNAKAFRHVPYSVHPIGELEDRVRGVRKCKNSEGAVLYLCDRNNNTIGLVKVKSTDYVVRRRLRESLRSTLVNPMFKGNVVGFEAHSLLSRQTRKSKPSMKAKRLPDMLASIRANLPQKMAALTHIPSHKSDAPLWGSYALKFLDWWLKTRVADFKASIWSPKGNREYEFAYLEWRHRYGSLLADFDTSSSSDVGKNDDNDDDDSAPAVSLLDTLTKGQIGRLSAMSADDIEELIAAVELMRDS